MATRPVRVRPCGKKVELSSSSTMAPSCDLRTTCLPGKRSILSSGQGRDVVCRVVEGRNLPTVKGYIEVEFMEQVNDFWRIHQTSEHVNAPAPQAPVLVSPPATVAAALPPPSAPAAAPRAIARGGESESQSGGGPSFEDIAGIVRMSPAPRPKAAVPDAQPFSPKTKSDLSEPQAERVKSVSSMGTLGSISNATHGKRTVPPPQEYSSLPTQKPVSSSDFMTRGMLAAGQTSADSSGEGRGRMGLIVGGLALVLGGIGSGYFLMHRGSVPSAPIPMAAVQHPAALQPVPLPPAPSSEVEPPPVSQPDTELPVPQPQPVSATASVEPDPDISSSSATRKSRPADKSAEAVQPGRPSKQRQQVPSLKLSTPSAPKQDLAKLSGGSAPSLTDLSSAVAVGSAPSADLTSPVLRVENQPAAPPSPVSVAPVSRDVREPKLITSTRPTYPAAARQSSTQGTVVVSAELDVTGKVISAKAISGPATLREAAIDSVKQWKYSPALIDGRPSTAQVTVNVQFRLN